MDSLTLSIAIACVTSVGGAIIGILFVTEREEADRLAEENTELRAALEAKRTEAGTLSDEVSRLTIKIKEQSETLAYREREINSFHARGYYRNAYGTLQRYSEWFEFGDKKPKPKRKEKKRDEQKPLTRAEACLAILNEAKDAGFPWAESAIRQMRKDHISGTYAFNRMSPLRDAVILFNIWSLTREGIEYWCGIAYSKEVQSFKPKTQWPA